LPQDKALGIQFIRTDLEEKPISALASSVLDASARATILGSSSGYISTVEHLLSALAGLGIDDLTVQIDGPEVPILDGSALNYIEAIQIESIIEKGDQERAIYRVLEPIIYRHEQTLIMLLPDECSRYTCVIDYPQNKFIGTQFFNFEMNLKDYCKEVAPCRTFCLFEEIEAMKEMGLIKGASLDIAVVIKGDQVLTPGGLRFLDEMVRHKLLDLMGDLSLSGRELRAQVVAIRPGHQHNVALAKKIEKLDVV
jgi:UDP-3-O-acyl N-acetylglucosamine deacetylase